MCTDLLAAETTYPIVISQEKLKKNTIFLECVAVKTLTKVRHCQIIMVEPQGVVGGVPLISISGSFPSNLRSLAAE
jgi:hypothetical protein